jgi:plastocyanin
MLGDVGLALLAGAALAAVPVTGAFAAGPKAARPLIYTVTIQQMAFSPPPPIRVGDTIEWVNNDIFVHSATAKDKQTFDVELKPKQHLWTTFHAAGRYPFYCRFHPGMTGTLVVTDKAR